MRLAVRTTEPLNTKNTSRYYVNKMISRARRRGSPCLLFRVLISVREAYDTIQLQCKSLIITRATFRTELTKKSRSIALLKRQAVAITAARFSLRTRSSMLATHNNMR